MFGKNIKKIRGVKALSQQAFADLFGLKRGTLAAYEEGRSNPRLETVIKIARHFNKEMEELLGISGFLRVHRSFIISKTRARFFASGKIEFENFEIPVGRKYRKEIEHYLRSENI